MELKEILTMFKTEQDYAERKNQIIFIFLGIVASLTGSFLNKIESTLILSIILLAFLHIGFNVLSSFFPQGKIINNVSFYIKWNMNRDANKKDEKDDNKLNFLTWKNFEVSELEKALEHFGIKNEKENKDICEQILITSRITYLKLIYFKWSCVFIGLWGFIITILFVLHLKQII